MNKFLRFLTDSRTLAALVLLAIVGLVVLAFWLDPTARLILGLSILAILVIVLLVLLFRWLTGRIRAFRSARGLDEMVTDQADTEAIRERLQEVVKAIKQSPIGWSRGRAALYDLPWYMIIGNPAAGKSTAIINSGLSFPFSDNRASVIKGIGGTRNCDWYFTNEGIVLDTAGRFSVNEEDHSSWRGFLNLLRKNRPRAPINGILIAASIAELNANDPEFAINLAKSLRERVQEVIEELEVFVPVYVIFTKADLISGFNDFFHTLEPGERERVWGATLPFEPEGNGDAVTQFEQHFDELVHGLKEMSLSQMTLKHGDEISPGLLTLPLEFAAIKPSLQAFISTLFEDNPYQFRPVFRGFYFTSAIQEGASLKQASKRVAEEFALQNADEDADASPETEDSFFLHDLFRKIIFGDRGLVRQYSHPQRTRIRYAVFFAAALALGAALSLWTWSYMNNRAYIAAIQADLQQAVELQQGQLNLQSRLKATLVLQRRLKQLMAYPQTHPLAVELGLYPGQKLVTKVRSEYYSAMRKLMLRPVSSNIETYLRSVVAHSNHLKVDPEGSASSTDKPTADWYRSLSPTSAKDAYNVLKTYLMLGPGDKHLSVSHLSEQLPRFWRAWLEANRGEMSREAMVEMASKLISFYLSQAERPAWPTADTSVTLVSSTRQALRQVMQGMPAVERTYTHIKARASTRFPSVTVASILARKNKNQGQSNQDVLVGSYAVSGTFTHEGWKKFVKPAIKKAAHKELSTRDWVLNSSMQGDLSATRNPLVVQRVLTRKYKKEYIEEWRKFLHGIAIANFSGFKQASEYIAVLSDPKHSPLQTLLKEVAQQTQWDKPLPAGAQAKKAKEKAGSWFSDLISQNSPSMVNAKAAASAAAEAAGKMPVGKIARSFPGIARLMAPRSSKPSLLQLYLDQLRNVSLRLDNISKRGVVGRGTLKLMQQTLKGKGSEIAKAVDMVDKQILVGLDDRQRRTLHTLLLRPLTQTYSALVPPTEQEINRIWQAQVYQPFKKQLSDKYPFNPNAGVQASAQEIAQIFGPSGAIAQFGTKDLGALVIRRGNSLTPRRWADIAISLSPKLIVNYGLWISALNAAGQPTSGKVKQTTFQIQPRASFKVRQYTIKIQGQRLRYRNTPPQWSTFVWPVPESQSGVSVKAKTNDGRTLVLVESNGEHGLTKLFRTGHPKRLGENSYLLTWGKDGIKVSVKLRILNRPKGDNNQPPGLKGVQLPQKVAGVRN